jgi:C-terminal processing protease CtpA/Prc
MRISSYLSSLKLSFLILFLLGAFFSCKKEEPEPPQEPTVEEKARDRLYTIMKDWYLWYDKMPEVDVNDYKGPEDLLEALRYKELDKWSFVAEKSLFESYFGAGQYLGFGFGYGYDEAGKIWISFVFKDSPLYPEGVRRGWRLTAVDDHVLAPNEDLGPLMGDPVAGVQKKLTFLSPDSNTVSVTAIKDTISMNAVLLADTLHVNNEVVGHLVFQTFVQTAMEELDSAFAFFKSVNVSDLIVDLRYNGGGSLNVAQKLGSLIAGNANKGKTLCRLEHNDKRSNQDEDVPFQEEEYALNLNRIIYITSRGSASASEVIINGLTPFMSVSLIGDRTYGKPVGMHSWIYDKYVFVPVSFKLVNANGEGDYFDGIPADDYAPDGLQYAFSDRREPRLKDAIIYIETGTYPNPGQKKSAFVKYPVWKGLQQEIGAL